MKKLLFLSLALLLFFSYQNELNASENNRKGGLRVTPRNTEELKGAIDLRYKQLESGLNGLEESSYEIVKNQNKFRAGVQNLMIMENMVGESELRDVSESLNDTVERSLDIEKEFNSRSFLKKIFFGHKSKSREDFSSIINNRKEGIEKLENIYNNCSCDGEVKSIFENQLNDIKKEQERIELLYKKEGTKKGFFPWVLSLFK